MAKKAPLKRRSGSVKLRERKNQDGTITLYLDIYQSGQKRQYDFLGGVWLQGDADDANRRQMAEQKRAQREMELLSGRLSVVSQRGRNRKLIDYAEAVQAKRPDDQAWPFAVRQLRLYLESAGLIDATLRQITPKLTAGYRDYLLAGKLKQNTAWGYFAKFRLILPSLVAEGALDPAVLTATKTIKVHDTETTYLTIDELRTLSATRCGNPEIKRAFLFCCYTGLRISDVRKLKPANIQNGRIVFRQQKTEASGKVDYVPLSRQAQALLDEREPTGGFFFHLPTKGGVNRVLKTWAKRAKINKRLYFHVSRHTHATLLLEADVNLKVVSTILGHRSTKMTERYVHVLDKAKQAAVDLIPSLDLPERTEDSTA